MAQGLAREEKTPNFWCVFFSNHLILIFMVDVLCLIFLLWLRPPFFLMHFFPIFSSFPCCFCFIGVLSCLFVLYSMLLSRWWCWCWWWWRWWRWGWWHSALCRSLKGMSRTLYSPYSLSITLCRSQAWVRLDQRDHEVRCMYLWPPECQLHAICTPVI